MNNRRHNFTTVLSQNLKVFAMKVWSYTVLIVSSSDSRNSVKGEAYVLTVKSKRGGL